MRLRLHNIIAACLLIFSIGGQWAFLQSVAWVGMLAKYSQQESFTVAVAKTFDGKHPCSLCKAVAQGKQTEEKRSLVKNDLKLTWILVHDETHLWSPLAARQFFPGTDAAILVFSSPPTPPPRSA